MTLTKLGATLVCWTTLRPLVTVMVASTPVVLAMNGWDEGQPAWWLNLEANPSAVMRLKGEEQRPVRARRAEGDERERLWRRWAAIDEGLDAYAASRTADTPVVVFEPATDEGG